MLPSRIILYLLLILLLMNYYCEGQNEIRKAVKAKANRKADKGKENVRHVKDKTRGAVDRTDAKINRKHQNTKRKMNAIKHVIKS
jgi:hypothetical protein